MTTSDLDCVLTTRLARLRALRSAWVVLAPSVLSDEGIEISETGRALTDRLARIQETGGEIMPRGLKDVDAGLDEFEASIRSLARDVPVSQFRSTLPTLGTSHRDGILDLLDVLIGKEPSEFATAIDCIGTVDYLVTLLCTSRVAPGLSVGHDPVTLTTRFNSLCQYADEVHGAEFLDVEAEFFAAANMDGEDLREEIQFRTLRSRKIELGMAFFIPRILRSVVTYNAALLDRVADEILSSSDWGFVGEKDVRNGESAASGRSVFVSEPLRTIAEAVGRRVRGEECQPNASDRIAWALDFDYLEPAERKALLGNEVGASGEPLGTAILVGLLCRSIAVLSIELQTIGISPDDVSDNWVAELGGLFQEQINTNISNDAYKVACALSELKNKFLSAPLADQFRQRKVAEVRVATPAETPAREARPAKRSESARDLVQDALEESRKAAAPTGRSVAWTEIPWARIAVAATLLIALAFAGLRFIGTEGDLDRWSREQLESVSPYLARGNRDGAGAGRAFIGTIDESWLSLPRVERGDVAEDLVLRLRDLGMSQIMIYDEDDALRIQAIGSQPIRIL